MEGSAFSRAGEQREKDKTRRQWDENIQLQIFQHPNVPQFIFHNSEFILPQWGREYPFWIG
jgi:hypothetical protein